VNTFSWDNFYERLGGGKLLQGEIEALRKSYDYILIDSRTGVSDTSGICTVQLPDMLAVFFTLNWQSIKGAAAVALSVQAQRGTSFPIYPVPSRIENGEQAKLMSATRFARHMFAPLLLHIQSDRSKVALDEQAAYWNEVETPYITFYAFEEVPAAFQEDSGSLRGVLAPMERLAARLTGKRVTALKPETDALRSRVVAAYEFKEDREGEGKIAWDADAAPRSLVNAALARLKRLLEHRTWQLATVALGAVALLLVIRVADLSSQWSGFALTLNQLSAQVNDTAQFVQEARKLNAPASINESNIQIYAKLKAIEGGLNTLKTSAQVLPQRVQTAPQLQQNQ
jgi:hypothetical protein